MEATNIEFIQVITEPGTKAPIFIDGRDKEAVVENLVEEISLWLGFNDNSIKLARLDTIISNALHAHANKSHGAIQYIDN